MKLTLRFHNVLLNSPTRGGNGSRLDVDPPVFRYEAPLPSSVLHDIDQEVFVPAGRTAERFQKEKRFLPFEKITSNTLAEFFLVPDDIE